MDNSMKKRVTEIRNELGRRGLNWEESSSEVLGEIYFTPFVRVNSKHRHGKQYLDSTIILNLSSREYGAVELRRKWEFIPDEAP